MIISLNWLKKYVDIDLPIEKLTKLIGSRLVEIEKTVDLGAKYKNILIVKAVECEKLEGTDHLSLVKIDDGGTTKDIDRDGRGLIQVICGASNIATGQMVVWLPPGSTVPATFDTNEPIVLDSREIRGQQSSGMIASPKELDLYDDHKGILILAGKEMSPGKAFAELTHLNDYLLDIENKSLTHRPDCFGVVGFAREVSAILGKPFKTPDWLMETNPQFESLQDGIRIEVSIDDPELAERYMAVVVSGIDTSQPSPVEIQTYLARVGVRPVNAAVDVTNYVMLSTGQPLHAFDYDKCMSLVGDNLKLHVRSAREGEELELLDGRLITLSSADIVIAANDIPVALAGAMGGANTAVDENTKNIILESATFNLFNLRATQMRQGIFSEAITRFTKGQPAGLTAPALAYALRLLGDWSGSKQASDVAEALGTKRTSDPVSVSSDKINAILGTNFDVSAIKELLANLEFEVQEQGSELIVKPPYWRPDIHLIEDIAEEVGRISGFDEITPTLPERTFAAVSIEEFDTFRRQVCESLVRAGSNEVLTYSFVPGSLLEKSGQSPDNSYKIVNSMSPDLQYYRQTLTPSLLGLIHPNIKQGYDDFALFEINKIHQKGLGLTGEGVPIEVDSVALVVTGEQSGAPYYRAKRLLDYLAKSLGLELKYQRIEDNTTHNPLLTPFELRRSALVIDSKTEIALGVIGEYNGSTKRAFKLSNHVAGFEIDTRKLFEAVQGGGVTYSPLSKYPSTARDICFQVSGQTSYDDIVDVAKNELATVDLESKVDPVDIYQPDDGKTKNITIRITLTAHDRTLTGDEVTTVINGIAGTVSKATNATII